MYGKQTLPLAALASIALAGCPSRDISKKDPSGAIEARQEIPVSQARNVDILFVIDNSHSMKEEQESLARNFVNFINVLNTIEGGLPSIHLGVVSSDMGLGGWTSEGCSKPYGDDGALLNAPQTVGCKPPDDAYIYDIQLAGGTRDKNYEGSLADAFSCIAKIGISGCGVEQHLEAMKVALDGTRPQNQGFLRRDAYLAVVILADEDDCSSNKAEIIFDPNVEESHINSQFGPFNSFRCTEFGIQCAGQPISRAAADYMDCVPRQGSASELYINNPQTYFDFLKGLKGNQGLLIGAVIAGNPTPVGVGLTDRGVPTLKPSCQSSNGIADPGLRLKAFADQFGDHGTFVSICQDDLSGAVDTVAQLLKRVIGTTCLQGDIDTTDLSATMPGMQLDCSVSDIRFAGETGEMEKSVARCPMTGATTPNTAGTSADKPCWWVTENTSKCNDTNEVSHLELKIERGGQDAPIGTSVVARCIVN